MGKLGNRYLVVTSDGHNQIDESDEMDNTAVSASALGLQAPDLPMAESFATASFVRSSTYSPEPARNSKLAARVVLQA